MRVVIRHDPSDEVDRLARILRARGHQVERLESLAAGIDGPSPEVTILSLSGSMAPAFAVCGPTTYVIALLPALRGPLVAAAYQQGAHDVMAQGASAEEVIGRVEAPARLRRWSRHLQVHGGEGRPGTCEGIGCTAVWTSAADVVASELSTMVGASLAVRQAGVLSRFSHGAWIPLSVAGESTRALVGFGMAHDSARVLSRELLASALDDALVADALREFANGAAGALKRGLLAEGFKPSIGLPEDGVDVPDGARAWVLESRHLSIHLWTLLEQTTATRVAACQLQQGMVVSRTIRSGSGSVLVAEGCVLTERTVERLVRLVGANTLVSVAEAA